MPDADVDLTGCLLKLERAQAHIEELRREVDDFLDDDPFGYSTEQHTLESGIVECTVTITIARQPPPEWALIIGDAVQNTRIGLEYLAYEMTPKGNRRFTEFPICTTEAAFAKKASRLQRMDERSRTLIENVQPCFWPDPKMSPLTRLQALSNQDKHNLLIALATARSGREHVGASADIVEGSFTMAVGPLEHGQQAMSFRARPDDPDAGLTLHPHVSLQVVVESYPDVDVVSLVANLHNYARHWIVESYERGHTPPKPEPN